MRLVSLSKQWQRNINTSEIHATPKKDIPEYSGNINTSEIHATPQQDIPEYSRNMNCLMVLEEGVLLKI